MYYFAISGITGDGTLGISIASGTASDNASNQAQAAGPSATVTVLNTVPGNVNGDDTVNLGDVLLILKIISGLDPGETVDIAADVNGDGKIGFEELIYCLRKTAGM